jgi:probable rRNA maturation factor
MNARPVSIANRHRRLQLDRRAVIRVIHLLDYHHATVTGLKARNFPGELSLVFLTDDALAALHANFLDNPAPTDVITFEGNPVHGTGGEICVSADTAARYAQAHGCDFSEELTLYVVHGWLHLAGHDDLAPARKRMMRRAEARAMSLLWKLNALPRMALRPQRRR